MGVMDVSQASQQPVSDEPLDESGTAVDEPVHTHQSQMLCLTRSTPF